MGVCWVSVGGVMVWIVWGGMMWVLQLLRDEGCFDGFVDVVFGVVLNQLFC